MRALVVIAYSCCFRLASAGTCALSGSACICTDDEGNSYDVTRLTPAGNANAPTTVVARGACSGTYCQGTGFEYYVDFCSALPVPQTCYTGSCCSPSDSLNLYRTDMRATCPPTTSCQCDKLGDLSVGDVVVTALDTGDDSGISIEFPNNSYYDTYPLWVRPVINLICDSAPSSAYQEIVAPLTANPEVVNTPGCNTNFCSVVINWRTPVACRGGVGWMIVFAMCAAAGVYVIGGVAYSRYANGHWVASERACPSPTSSRAWCPMVP